MAHKNISGIAAAVSAAGTQDKLARHLGVTQQAVNKWALQGWVPLKRAGEIEKRFHIARSRLVNPKILSALGVSAKRPPP